MDRQLPFRHLFAAIPVRGLEAAKARLGEALDAEERSALVEGLLRRTVAAAQEVPAVEGVIVVSPDVAVRRLAAEAGAATAAQRHGDLNEGLDLAREHAIHAGADAILVVPADLPAVSSSELAAVIDASQGGRTPHDGPGEGSVVVLVTDRAADGTNVLLVAPPGAIPFAFGPGSRARHAALAAEAGATYVELTGPLALDLDLPDDLLAAEAEGLGAVRAGVP